MDQIMEPNEEFGISWTPYRDRALGYSLQIYGISGDSFKGYGVFGNSFSGFSVFGNPQQEIMGTTGNF